MKIYVGNIARESTEEEVKELFTSFGTVENFKLIRDINSNFIKGFGFVDMPNDDEAQKAIDELNGQLFKERPLTVSLANPNSADKKNKKRPADKGKGGFNKGGGFNKTGGSGGGTGGYKSGGGTGGYKSGGGTGGYKSGGGTGGYKSGGYKGGKSNEGNKPNGNREVNGNREGGNEGSGVNYFNKY
jgi:RNA recognition motif-containing protein